MANTKEQMKKFKLLAINAFEDILKTKDFKPKSKKTDKYGCDLIYIKSDKYIKISANIDLRDFPPYFNIVLGEGRMEWPDTDWNSIALWHLKNLVNKNNNGSEYSLEKFGNLENILEHAKDDLIKYGHDFLNDDLELFYEVRALMNKDRKPYKIHTPNKDGSYSMKYDEKSVELKEKYSKKGS